MIYAKQLTPKSASKTWLDWSMFGSVWIPFGRLWIYFGCVWICFGLSWIELDENRIAVTIRRFSKIIRENLCQSVVKLFMQNNLRQNRRMQLMLSDVQLTIVWMQLMCIWLSSDDSWCQLMIAEYSQNFGDINHKTSNRQQETSFPFTFCRRPEDFW